MIRVALYIEFMVHRLASCMVGMILNLCRSLCLRSLSDFYSYFQFIVLKRVMSLFLYLSKELPDAGRITASPSSRHNQPLVKSKFLWISVSMYNPTSSQMSAPSKCFPCGRIGLFFLHVL